MVYTDVRVKVWTREGPITLTDQVRAVQVQDALGKVPEGTVLLPLHRTVSPTSRKRYSELIGVGDLCLIEMLAWDGKRGDWEAVLHGPVVAIEETEPLGPEAVPGTRLGVASMAHLLAQDTVAQWMWLGSVAGWKVVESQLLKTEMNQDPASVVYNYLTKVAFHLANYQNGGWGLKDLIHLDLDGLEAVGPFSVSLAMVEGPHLEIVKRLVDYPLMELYVTTDRAANLKGRHVSRAGSAPGEGQAATVVRMRKAPYPFPDAGEWEALPLHALEGTWQPVRGRAVARTDAVIRNYFVAYPALTFVDETHLMAIGATVANRKSIRRYGYRPMKIRTHLIHNETPIPEETLADFMAKLAMRMAAQWNRLHEMETGTIDLPLAPWIRPGHRVKGPSLWGAGERVYHVRGRSLSWEAGRGGQMTLAVERGLPPEVYKDPGWFAEGLEVVRIGADARMDYVKEQKRK